MRLTINLATRGRPELVTETVERTLNNIRHPETVLVVSLDADDDESVRALLDRDVNLCVRKREDSLGAKYNRALQYPADVYLMMVDYAPHMTPGFDEKILEAASVFPDGIGVVLNEKANLSFSGINAVTHKLALKMGGIYPTYFPCWFIDHWLEDIAAMIARVSYADVQIDTSRRPGTQNRRDIPFWTDFYTRMAPEREAIAAKIIGCGDFMIPEWQKQQLLRNLPLVRQRSEIINAMVAAACVGNDTAPDGPQHKRLRSAALALLDERKAA